MGMRATRKMQMVSELLVFAREWPKNPLFETPTALYANNPRLGGCRHCKKANHKEDQCWKKFPRLIPDWVRKKNKEEPSC
jgi:hypothetical protein